MSAAQQHVGASPLYPVGQYVVQQPLSADHLYYPHESGFPAPTGRNVVPVSFVTNQQRNGVACGTLTEDSVIMYPNGADFTYPKVPTYITCQHCGAKVLTDVDSQCGASYILSCLVCLVCFPLGILLLTGSSNDYVHTCPSCKQEVGTNSSC